MNQVVLRGGSWNNLARLCRAACRNRYYPDDRFHFIGFRVTHPSQEGGVGGEGWK